MDLFRKLKLKLQLKDCDYDIARMAIVYKFSGNVLKDDIAETVKQFTANPCFETAINLIERDPEFYVFFVESKPDGFFVRNLESIKKKN